MLPGTPDGGKLAKSEAMYIVVDLEATCWENGNRPELMEIIEIGAVRLNTDSIALEDVFSSFVKPVLEPILSEFCKQLTSIRQENVDQAEPFKEVFEKFLSWIGTEPFTLCSWGAYDLNQFKTDCLRHSISFPASFNNHINLKQEFAALKKIRPRGMKKALQMIGLGLEGQHHRAIDDARNIARIAQLLLPAIATKSGR